MDVFLYDQVASSELLDRVNGLFNGAPSESKRSSLPVDVVEDHDGYRFSVELPGLKTDSLDVKVENETLVIDAERSQPAWAKDALVHRPEAKAVRIEVAYSNAYSN